MLYIHLPTPIPWELPQCNGMALCKTSQFLKTRGSDLSHNVRCKGNILKFCYCICNGGGRDDAWGPKPLHADGELIFYGRWWRQELLRRMWGGSGGGRRSSRSSKMGNGDGGKCLHPWSSCKVGHKVAEVGWGFTGRRISDRSGMRALNSSWLGGWWCHTVAQKTVPMFGHFLNICL